MGKETRAEMDSPRYVCFALQSGNALMLDQALASLLEETVVEDDSLLKSGAKQIADHPVESAAAGIALLGTAAVAVATRGRVFKSVTPSADDAIANGASGISFARALSSKLSLHSVRDSDEIAKLQKISDQLPGLNANLWKFHDVGGQIRVAEVRKQPVGFIAYHRGQEPTGVIDIAYLGVDPKFQGMGLGKKLMQSVVHDSHFHGDANILGLSVRVSNSRAISLYEKLGFREVKRLSNYYSAEDGIGMIRELRPNGWQRYLDIKASLQRTPKASS